MLAHLSFSYELCDGKREMTLSTPKVFKFMHKV